MTAEDDLERRLLAEATGEEEKEAIRRLLEHHRRVNHARSIELFIQALGQLQQGFAEERRHLRKIRSQDAGLRMLDFVAGGMVLLGAWLIWLAVVQ